MFLVLTIEMMNLLNKPTKKKRNESYKTQYVTKIG